MLAITIGSRKITPPRMLRIVPFGERYISFRPNSSHARLVGGDRGALHPHAVRLIASAASTVIAIFGGVAALDPEVVVLQLHVEVGQDQLLLDERPDDPRHLVAVELDDGVLHLDLGHVGPSLEDLGGGRCCTGPPRLTCSGRGSAPTLSPGRCRSPAAAEGLRRLFAPARLGGVRDEPRGRCRRAKGTVRDVRSSVGPVHARLPRRAGASRPSRSPAPATARPLHRTAARGREPDLRPSTLRWCPARRTRRAVAVRRRRTPSGREARDERAHADAGQLPRRGAAASAAQPDLVDRRVVSPQRSRLYAMSERSPPRVEAAAVARHAGARRRRSAARRTGSRERLRLSDLASPNTIRRCHPARSSRPRRCPSRSCAARPSSCRSSPARVASPSPSRRSSTASRQVARVRRPGDRDRDLLGDVAQIRATAAHPRSRTGRTPVRFAARRPRALTATVRAVGRYERLVARPSSRALSPFASVGPHLRFGLGESAEPVT